MIICPLERAVSVPRITSERTKIVSTPYEHTAIMQKLLMPVSYFLIIVPMSLSVILFLFFIYFLGGSPLYCTGLQ